MAKPCKPNHNRPDASEVSGEGGDCAGVAEAEAKGRGGKQGGEAIDPPLQKGITNIGAPRGHRERI